MCARAAEAPLRLAIAECMVGDVNPNDARAAMTAWLKRMIADYNLPVEFNPKVFETPEEIVRRVRAGQVDSVALSIMEYRQLADLLDPSQVICESGTVGLTQYLLLVKRSSGIQKLGDLRGRRVGMLKAVKMCVAQAWLACILDEARLAPAEQFFGNVTTDLKAARVVLPVFFGQSDACVTSRRSYDMMCELNPQVGRDLTVLASSQPMVVLFYMFHKNYHGGYRDRFARIYSGVGASVAGKQLATLFQFDNLVVQDVACLAPALAVLETADRIRARAGGREPKGTGR